MNKKILNLLIISSCAMFSVAANYDELSRFGLQNNTTNTQKPLPTEQSIGPSITPATTPLMPRTTPGIEEKLKAPEFSKQEIQKLEAIINGQPPASKEALLAGGCGLILCGMVIGQLVSGYVGRDLILPGALGVGCLGLGYVDYQKDIEKAKNCRKDLIEKTNKINNFYEENSKNPN